MLSDPEASKTDAVRERGKIPTDSELIDWLESDIKASPMVLWEGTGEFPGTASRLRGLSMLGGLRSMREALAILKPSQISEPSAETGTTPK